MVRQRTNMIPRIILGIFVLTLLAFFVLPKPQSTKLSPLDQQTVPQQVNRNSIHTITLTPKGFEPQEITIKKNDVIVWTNKSGKRASVNSAEYPTHRLFPVLNLGIFEDGQSVQTRILRAGEFRYVNHYIPQQTGTITVKN